MPMQLSKKSWWETSSYEDESLLPDTLKDPGLWGPHGPALVRVNANGSTQKGWGELEFDAHYSKNEFGFRRAEQAFQSQDRPSAIVMRSMRGVVIDIDGKNGGLQGVGQLGALPITAAEISKSGNGYHIVYSTPESWVNSLGFAAIPDQIGIVQGVDIRGVGCVYHYPGQRWNNEPVVEAPAWLMERLTERARHRSEAVATIEKVLEAEDPTEIMLMQSTLMDELSHPIPAGRRNNTLFAIAGQMKLAQVDEWQTLVRERGAALGLGQTEIDKLVSNVERFG